MAPNDGGPPREAVKQGDGSYVQQMEDGSTMRWTRRPDGSWRKPEHKRAGWVGELEQQKYVSKGAEIEHKRQEQMQAQIGRVPGLGPEAESEGFNKSRNERKKEKRKEKAEEKIDAARFAEPSGYSTREYAELPSGSQEAAAVDEDSMAQKDAGKEERNIRKKLRQIEELEQREAQGETLNDDQQGKIASKSKLEADLKAVLSGEPVPAPEPPKPKVVANATVAAKEPEIAVCNFDPPAATLSVEEPAPAPPAGPKNKKAIEKKLRQISEIEEKERNGEELNDDQRQKLATKKQLQAELKACA